MGFIGVSTGASSIMRIFPVWAEILELPTRRLEGHDLPLDATDAQYRALVEAIRDDPDHRGALVTTHKMALYAAASDLFDELDEFARACGEVSSIAKRGERLLGHAKDPLTAGLALDEIVGSQAFGGVRDAVVLGAGGAGLALTWRLAEREDAPRRIVVTDTSRARLDHLAEVHARRGTPLELLHLVEASPEATRAVLADAPAGSLVVNASGLGKDRPGSPLPDGTPFPERAVAWEFNYRGSLEFLRQAEAQAAERGLEVVDGWRYFIHGWTQVIAEVFGLEMTPALVERLADAATPFR
ncbi:saccharopine dehydrogenase NADP-binding domain-containing protein [Agrococcus sp. HG114]|nr:saccharopine dehydrogenase NADP-binding domain-containing protein [Agrococcus sp. HG114]MCR8670064.1 saccharopine dehydrogenase NADP-binding domain-containing protein [Agrococcus sp. HG114]